MRILSRRSFIRFGVTGILAGFSTGCGTILYPERKGQSAGPLDWGVVGLDALGLLLFFVPGVIAFAIDFHNGSIYLPVNEYGHSNKNKKQTKLNTVAIPAGHISQMEIARIVSKETGRDIKLINGEYETQAIESIDEFWKTTDQMIQHS